MWGSDVDRGVCEHDAVVVRRLRDAGAVVVGKTNVPELTLWPWTASARWGVTRNPWDLDRTPGGSSGGSAVAVSTGMAAIAVGSDGGGSIRYPAGLTGLVGLKPQRDRVPIGVEHGSGWHGLVAIGPLTRSVRDTALFLDVTAGGAGSTFRTALDSPAPTLRVAAATNPPPGSKVSVGGAVRRAIDDVAGVLVSLGHEVTDAEVDYPLASLRGATVRLLAGVRDDVATMPTPERLEARTRRFARMGRTVSNGMLERTLRAERRVAAAMNAVFDDADVLLTPLCESPAPHIDECPSAGALRSLRRSNTSAWLVPWNVTGQPAISIPTGTDEAGLPVAVQLVGRPHDEATLLNLAAAIEAVRPHRRSPGLPLDVERG